VENLQLRDVETHRIQQNIGLIYYTTSTLFLTIILNTCISLKILQGTAVSDSVVTLFYYTYHTIWPINNHAFPYLSRLRYYRLIIIYILPDVIINSGQ